MPSPAVLRPYLLMYGCTRGWGPLRPQVECTFLSRRRERRGQGCNRPRADLLAAGYYHRQSQQRLGLIIEQRIFGFVQSQAFPVPQTAGDFRTPVHHGVHPCASELADSVSRLTGEGQPPHDGSVSA